MTLPPQHLNRRHTQLPEWIRAKRIHLQDEHAMRRILRQGGVRTICEEGRCPNRSECFAWKNATFLLLGPNCTRNCGFCNVGHGKVAAPDPDEIDGVVRTVRAMDLSWVVITMVTRDDLPDGGAGHVARCMQTLYNAFEGVHVEALISDFKGDPHALETVLRANPTVLGHNVETVRRLTSSVRSRAAYDVSLKLLARVKSMAPSIITKSGFMVGLGEREDEIMETLEDLFGAGCDVVTIGQYLQPNRSCLPVQTYWPPERFEAWKRTAEAMGFKKVFCAPFVRSSYMAHTVLDG